MATSIINQVMNNSGENYCKMPDGTLIQWGRNQVTTASTSGIYPGFGNNSMYRGVTDVTFPIPFTNTPAVVADGDNRLYGAFGINETHTTNSKFSVEGGHNAANTTISFFWVAIGRWK